MTDRACKHTILVVDNDPAIRLLLRLALRRSHPSLPVIAMSGKSGPLGLLFTADAFGAVKTFSKPFEIAAINDELAHPDKEPPVQNDRPTRRVAASIRFTAVLLCCGSLVSCTSPAGITQPGQTHYVRIQDRITPQRLYVTVGDEVRWQNLRATPVTISLLTPLTADSVSCRKGFSHFGSFDDTATIPPDEYVSLCFSRAGTIQYNLWLDPADPLRSMTPTAHILVSTQPT